MDGGEGRIGDGGSIGKGVCMCLEVLVIVVKVVVVVLKGVL